MPVLPEPLLMTTELERLIVDTVREELDRRGLGEGEVAVMRARFEELMVEWKMLKVAALKAALLVLTGIAAMVVAFLKAGGVF